MRQVLALLVGIASGVFPLYGGYGFALYSLVIIFVPFWYYSTYSKVNIDDFGPFELITEGLQNSVGVFLLVWVLSYSAVGFNRL